MPCWTLLKGSKKLPKSGDFLATKAGSKTELQYTLMVINVLVWLGLKNSEPTFNTQTRMQRSHSA